MLLQHMVRPLPWRKRGPWRQKAMLARIVHTGGRGSCQLCQLVIVGHAQFQVADFKL